MLNKFYADDGSATKFNKEHSSDIFELIKTGNWDVLKNMPVAFEADGTASSYWKDHKWESKLWIKGTEKKLPVFRSHNYKHLSNEIINEIKALTYLLLYKLPTALAISTITGYVSAYKNIASYLSTINISTFGDISNDIIKQFQTDTKPSSSHESNIAINCLRALSDSLPFDVQLESPASVYVKSTQTPVTPERLQMQWMQDAEQTVLEWSKYQTQFSAFISKQIELFDKTGDEIVKRIRNGESKINCIHSETNTAENKIASFLSDLEEHGIPLTDKNESADWMVLFKKHNLWIDPTAISAKLKFASHNLYKEDSRVLKFRKKTFSGFNDLRKTLKLIEKYCIYLIFNLSGMRQNEFHKLIPEFGAQTILVNGHKVHIFHSGQQKIKVGYQLKKDVFVTTALGHKAFNLLNSIYEPFRDKAAKEKKETKGFRVTLNINNPIVSLDLPKLNHFFKAKLTPKDIEDLRVSEHGCKKFNYKEGDVFTFRSHMARRSLAYYLVALELCGFPQIKQQFSHLSMAMSIYYANNASKKNEMIMYKEVKDEREEQLALTLIRLKERAAEKKLSGGKGVIWNQSSEKLMSINEHKNLLRKNKEFITAVAPGMYCTNRNCCKTAQLSLVHDLSCNESIVENTAWIEGRRASSISKLMTLYAMDDLTPQDVSKELLNIRAAEQMINKHNGEGSIEPYIAPEGINKMLFTEAV